MQLCKEYAKNHKEQITNYCRDYYKQKHKYIDVWEKVYGKVPKGYVLLPKDGNKSTLNLDNLMLVSKSDLMLINRYGIKTDAGEEILKTGILISQLIKKRYKIEKEEKGTAL